MQNRNNRGRGRGFLPFCALVLSLVTVFFALVGCSGDSGDKTNFLSDDLSRYISLSNADYKGFPVTDVFYDITDFDVEEKIIKTLYANRDKTPIYDGKYYRNKPISIGDEVFLYYRGYTVDENGNEVDFDGGCNFFAGSAHQLGIGSGGFVSGFESSLVGVLPSDYSVLDIKDSGTVSKGDVIFFTYTVLSPDRNESKTSARIDLSRDDIDEIYGEGFKEFLLGGAGGDKPVKIGEAILGTKTFAVSNGSATYYNMKVDGVLREESEPITIDARFPSDYREVSLRGKWVKFDVYVEKVQYYNVPEYNDAFVTDTLKIDESELSDKPGTGAAEKYRELIREELVAENEECRLKVIEEAFWTYVTDKVVVKELPSDVVDGFYNEYYNEIASQYELYQSYYPDLESFGQAYYGINDGRTTVAQYMRQKAEEATLEKLIFYYVARMEGYLPSESLTRAESEKLIDEHLSQYLDGAYKTDYAACKTEEERANFRSDLREKIINNYGMEYFEEMVYYDVFMKKISETALIA